MAQLEITFGADGQKNGGPWTIYMCSGSTFEKVVVDALRWHGSIYGDLKSQQAFLLGVLRNKYPEVEWTRAFIIETKSL